MQETTQPSFRAPYLNSHHPPWSSYYLDYPRLLDLILQHNEDVSGNHKIATKVGNESLSLSPRRGRLRPSLMRLQSVASLPKHSLTRTFIDKLDDEIDKVTLFVIKQQGDIATKLLDIQGLINDEECKIHVSASTLFGAARQLLLLIKYMQANILAIDKLLTVHDRILAPYGIKIEPLFLAGKIGRERDLLNTHLVERSRLGVAYRHEGIKTLVGLFETIYCKLMKGMQNTETTWKQFREDTANKINDGNGHVGQVPVLNNADYLLNEIPRAQSLVSLLPNNEEANMIISKAEDAPHLAYDKANSKGNAQKETGRIHEIFLRIDVALICLDKSSFFVTRWAMASGIESNEYNDNDAAGEVQMLKRAISHREIGKDNRKVSSWLNLANSFLYMVSYYMVAPSSGEYAERLGLDSSMSGAIIGMTAFAALASTVLYSWWTSYSYKNALIFSSICCLLGNFIYALGLPFNSLSLVLIGRFLNGFGSARAINRRFIADAFSTAERTAASAAFVASSAAGMSFGPALAALMPIIVDGDRNLWWQEENAPAWIMAVVWSIFLVILSLFFQNPPKYHEIHDLKIIEEEKPTNGEKQSLLNNSTNFKKSSPRNEKPLWERTACLVTIFLVFMLKLVLELLLSSAAPITAFYFGWSSSLAGWYLAVGNGLVLPAISLVTYLSRYYQDRQLILFSQIMMLVGSVLMIYYLPDRYSYSLVQYIIGTCVLFIAPNIMEGPSMSLLSKNIPKSLTKGIFNLGFFTTEAGFGGRVVADSYLTMCGSGGIDHLVNALFGSLAIVNACTLALVCFTFSDLVEPESHYD